jgi:hypothetical protein
MAVKDRIVIDGFRLGAEQVLTDVRSKLSALIGL